MPGNRSDFDRNWADKYDRPFEPPRANQRVDIPDWKKADPGASTAWSRREDWNAGYDNPEYQDPYPSQDFGMPTYVAEDNWW